MLGRGVRERRWLLPRGINNDGDENSLGIVGWRQCLHANLICCCQSRFCATKTISEKQNQDTNTHTLFFFSVKLVYGNRIQAWVSFMNDSLGPIFIPCNVCSLSLGTEKKMLQSINTNTSEIYL